MSRVLHVHPSNAHLEAALGAHGTHENERELRTTLGRLEGALARELLPDVRTTTPEVVRVVLRRAVTDSAEASSLLGETMPIGALVDAFDRSLTELHRAGTDAELLLATANRAKSARDRTRARLLADVMRRTDEGLARLGLIDGRALAARLGARIDDADDRSLAAALDGANELELHDVIVLSAARLRWLERLHLRLSRSTSGARGAGGVRLELPTAGTGLVERCGIDDPRDRLATRVEDRWAALDDAPTLSHRRAGRPDAPFASVAARLFAAEGASSEAPTEAGDEPRIELVRAASVAVLADATACLVAAELRRGTPPSRIVVALPTLDDRVVRPLRVAFAALGVPIFEARGSPPKTSPAVAPLLDALRRVDRGLQKSDLIDLLLSAPLVPKARRRAIVEALEKTAGDALLTDEVVLSAALEARDLASLSPALRLLAAGRTPQARARALRWVTRLCELLGLPQRFGRKQLAEVVQASDERHLALSSACGAFGALANVLDDLVRATELARADEDPVSAGELAREIEASLDRRAQVSGGRAGAVAVTRLRDRIGLDTDVLVILEAHDGSLPVRGSPDPLLSRGLVSTLREVAPLRAPPPPSLVGSVDLLSALDAIGSTHRRVVVVHRAHDEDGRAQLPGALVVEVAARTRHELRDERARPIPSRDVPARRPGDLALHAHHRAAPLLARSLPPPPDVEPAAWTRAAGELERARAFASFAVGRELLGPRSGLVALRDVTRARLRTRLRGDVDAPFAVSKLDGLLSCPFVAFAERVLGAERRSPVDDEGGQLSAGTLAHAMLQRIHETIRDEALRGASALARAREVAELVVAESPASSALMAARRALVVEQVLSLVAIDLDDMEVTGRRFVAAEVTFGELDGGPYPALVLGVGADAVALRGRIDRHDERKDPRGGRVATVIDYKSTLPVGISGARFFTGAGSVQLPVYARVVGAQLGPEDRVEGRYVAYRRARIGPPIGTRHDDDAVFRLAVGDVAGGEGEGRVAAMIVEAFGAVRDGHVPARRNPRCERCDQRPACRAPDVVLEPTPSSGGGDA